MNGQTTDSSTAIKSMTLYEGVERVFNELRERGLDGASTVDIATLNEFDQLHYHGTDAVDEAVNRLGIKANDTILDIGAGFGGPARHLAATTGCNVIAVELQPDMCAAALDLTRRTCVRNKVEFVNADILALADELRAERTVQHIVSWLAFLHIPARQALSQLCHDALEPGGMLYFEDFFERAPFTAEDRAVMTQDLYCENLPTLDALEEQLASAGFTDIHLEDLTQSWSDFVQARLQDWRANRERNLRVHGEQIVDWLEHFYLQAHQMFARGNMGGLRAVARKPHG